MQIPTPQQFSVSSRRLDRLNQKVQRVIAALKADAVLQHDQCGGRPKLRLLPAACEGDGEVAQLVTRDFRVVGGADSLFHTSTDQTHHYHWRNS